MAKQIEPLDYHDRWDELESSQNPFAWVVMAHLKIQETTIAQIQSLPGQTK